MKRKQFLIICFLMIMILTAGYFTAYAMPLGQTEAAEETASESVIPVENTAAEGESGIELITREESSADGAVTETEDPAGETAAADAAAESGETAAEETTDEETKPTVEAPEAPVPEAPKGSAPSKEVGFYWSPSANAEHYEINWQCDRGFEGALSQDGDDWTCRAGRCIVFEELPSDGNYTWTVSAVNEGGSAASEEVTFSVQASMPAPEAYLPAAVLGNQKPVTFQWQDAGHNASAYRIQIMDQDTGLICLDKWYGTDQLGIVNGVCSLDSSEFLAEGSYAWRVQGRNSSSVSNWSPWRAFGVNCAECLLGTYLNTVVNIIAPNGTITDPAVPFVWQAVTGAFTYQLEIKHSDGTELLKTEVSPAENCSVEICTYKPELSFEVGESYEWSVETYGWNNIFWGSARGSFSVAGQTEMNEISFVGLEDNALLDPDNQQIIWTDPGKETASFRVGVSSSEGDWLFVGDLTRDEAWCDGLTCSVQFRTIPEGEGYQFTLVPYSEFNIPGEPLALTFSNKAAE